jgi:hypothetical protein
VPHRNAETPTDDKHTPQTDTNPPRNRIVQHPPSVLSGGCVALLGGCVDGGGVVSRSQPKWERIMAQRGRPTVVIELSDTERETLQRWVRCTSRSDIRPYTI